MIFFSPLPPDVTFEGIRPPDRRGYPESSPVSIIILAASLIIMPILAQPRRGSALPGRQPDLAVRRRDEDLRAAVHLHPGRADASAPTCGVAWPNPAAGFVIAAFAIMEGKEAWEGELVEDDDDDD
ncbi:hypothetical protein QJS66_19575 [Kocuria rhizophila]|nr:hypothetical protein QJS66_19575 [Kocuria rhizophila]